MIVIELQYDAYNRTFKPVDTETAGFFEHSEVYLVAISDSGADSQAERLDLRRVPIAHA
jgi:hypothetical protein